MTNYKNVMTAAIVALATFAAPAFAAETPAAATMAASANGMIKFGILDMDKVVQQSEAAKGIMTELEAKRKEYEAQISKEEKSLMAQEQDILKQKDKLSQDDFAKKRQEFEKKLNDAKSMVQDRKQTLDKAFSTSMGQLRTEALKITADIAKQRNFDVVLSDDAVVLAEPKYDITEEVVTRLNKSVKKIPVTWAKK